MCVCLQTKWGLHQKITSYAVCNTELSLLSLSYCRMLISFTKQKGVPDWWGYSLAFLMFFTAFLQTLILHRHFQYCFVTGMNVRTAIIGAIYRKVSTKFLCIALFLNRYSTAPQKMILLQC